MVSTQISSGTGFATELSRSWNDLFGSTSNASNNKLKYAIMQCKNELRIQCALNGGNAVIASDIDFNEIGSGSTNMLMVCMAGTAIFISNLENSKIRYHEQIGNIAKIVKEIFEINKIQKELNTKQYFRR